MSHILRVPHLECHSCPTPEWVSHFGLLQINSSKLLLFCSFMPQNQSVFSFPQKYVCWKNEKHQLDFEYKRDISVPQIFYTRAVQWASMEAKRRGEKICETSLITSSILNLLNRRQLMMHFRLKIQYIHPFMFITGLPPCFVLSKVKTQTEKVKLLKTLRWSNLY